MASITGNLGLTLPESFDKVDVAVLSNNFSLIDSAIANNLTTTVAGKVLDARQGRALLDEINNRLALTGGTLVGTLTVPYFRIAGPVVNGSMRLSEFATDGNGNSTIALVDAAGNIYNAFALTPDGFYTRKPFGVVNGGTGAADAATARANLGITPANIGAVTMKTTQITLSKAGWSSDNWQTVSVPGVTASNTVIVAPDYLSKKEYYDCGVACGEQGKDYLRFGATEATPTANMLVNVLILS